MRVLHAVTLHTPTNDFGGPTRVALNLSKGLRARGVDSRIVTLGDGFEGGALPQQIEGVPSWVFRARHVLPRFEVSGITSVPMLARARRLVKAADVVHVHLARDLITLPFALVALQCGVPVVLQTHGMVDPTDRRVAKLVDLLGLRRVLRRADALLYLTETERAAVQAVVEDTPLKSAYRLVNGVTPQERRPRGGDGPPTVVFLARVHPQKRPQDFIRSIPVVLKEHPDARFVMAGPDTGSLVEPMMRLAQELGVRESVEYVGALGHSEVYDCLSRADVYVLPSVFEPFGVSAVEAMSLGVPVVVTRSCGVAPDVVEAGAGRATDSREDADNGELVGRAVLDLLDPAVGAAASAAAWRLTGEKFAIDAVVRSLLDVYWKVRR